MAMYQIPSYHNLPAHVPGEISDFVTPVAWNEIRDISRQVDTAQSDSLLISCLGCLIFGPFACCCFPCILGCMRKQKLDQACMRVNNMHYRGAAIITPSGPEGLIINVTAIQSLQDVVIHQPGVYVAPAIPTVHVQKENIAYAHPGGVAPAMPTVAAVHMTGGVAPAIPMATAVPTAPYMPQSLPQRNQMRVTIPPGAGPGASIVVNTPVGTQVQVQIPPNAFPGNEIVVEY